MATDQQVAVTTVYVLLVSLWIGVVLIVVGILIWLIGNWKVSSIYYSRGIPHCPALIPQDKLAC